MAAATGVPIKPVTIHVGDKSPRRFSATVEGLMGILMSDRWPDKASPKFNGAMSACVDAAVGGTGDKARKAFVDAAHDAGIAVSPDDDRKPIDRRRKSSSPDRKTRRSGHSSGLPHPR